MQELTNTSIDSISGGVWNFVVPAVGGCAWGTTMYVVNSKNSSWAGAAYACGVGAASGLATNALIGAAGGGLLGNLSQRPGMMGLTWGVQQANPWK